MREGSVNGTLLCDLSLHLLEISWELICSVFATCITPPTLTILCKLHTGNKATKRSAGPWGMPDEILIDIIYKLRLQRSAESVSFKTAIQRAIIKL